jgi:uncharacterized protein Usg
VSACADTETDLADEVSDMSARIISRRAEPSSDFLKQLAGYGLTTAEILYRIPDHPRFLQTYVWQDYDIAPHFPTLMKFLTFWREKLDGRLYSVRIGHARFIKPAEINAFDAEFSLH